MTWRSLWQSPDAFVRIRTSRPTGSATVRSSTTRSPGASCRTAARLGVSLQVGIGPRIADVSRPANR